MSIRKNLALIIGKEYKEGVRKKSFIISTIALPLVMILATIVPVLVMKDAENVDKDKLSVVMSYDGTRFDELLTESDNIEYTKISTPKEGREIAANESTKVFVEADSNNSDNFTLYYSTRPSIAVINVIESDIRRVVRKERIKSYDIDSIEMIISDVNRGINLEDLKVVDDQSTSSQTAADSPAELTTKKESAIAPIAFSYIFSMLTYLFILMYGNQIITGIVAEKSSRVIEMIIPHIKPNWFMLGKIIGTGLIGITQVAIWIAMAISIILAANSFLSSGDISSVSSQLADNSDKLAQITTQVSLITDYIQSVDFVVMIASCTLYFIGGFLLYGALLAAAASSVETVQEAGQFTGPILAPIIIAFMIAVSSSVDSTNVLITTLSYIPLTSPIAMIVRLPHGTVALWEVALSIAILYATVAVVLHFASIIFKSSLITYDKKASWGQIIKWIRTKQ